MVRKILQETDAVFEDDEVAQESYTPAEQADIEAAGVGDNIKNVPTDKQRKRSFLKTVENTGAAYGAGLVSMIKLAEDVTEAASNNVVNVEDAEEIYDTFRAKASAKATIDDAGLVPDAAAMEAPKDVKSKDQQLSKVRAFIKLGNQFSDDAQDVIRRARNIHLGLLAQMDKATVKPGSTYTTLYAVAVAQLDAQKAAVKAGKATGTPFKGLVAPLDDNELRALMTQPANESTPKDGADKILESLIAAKAALNGSAERAPVTNDSLSSAIEYLRAALAETNADKLDDYEQKLSDAETKRAEVEVKRAQAAADKAAKAAMPPTTRKRGPKVQGDATQAA